jgi:hypothetical protein
VAEEDAAVQPRVAEAQLVEQAVAALHLQPLAVEEQALHPLPGYPLCRVALPPADEAVPARLATQTLDRPRSSWRNPFWIQTPWLHHRTGTSF